MNFYHMSKSQMDKFAKSADAIYKESYDKKFIRSPVRRLLIIMAVLFIAAAILIFGCMTKMVMVTAPLLLIEFIFYLFFCKIWLSYKYSVFWLVAHPLLALAIASGARVAMYYFTT